MSGLAISAPPYGSVHGTSKNGYKICKAKALCVTN